MQETVRTFLEAITAIKDPLKFWAFCAVIGFASLLAVLSKPKIIESLARITGRNTGKTQFFRLIRMSLWFLFIISLLTILMTFLAPIGMHGVDVVSGELSKKVLSAKGQILGSLELDRKLAKAFQYFEGRQYEKAQSILMELFEQTDRRPDGEFQGYVVATYYGAQNYEMAAREVLRRDRSNPPHDFSLWKDVTLCIRKYSLRNSFPAGLALVEKLQSEFGPKLISPVWAAFPMEVVPYLREGIHSRSTIEGLTEDQRRDLEYVVDKYPNAPFVEFALYALGRYDQAIVKAPRSLIKDVMAYARAYESVASLRANNFRDSIDLSAQEKALQQLSDFVRVFPNSPHADDAAVWCGWVAWQLGKIEESLRWFKASNTLGNRDYDGIAWEFQNRMLRTLPRDSLLSILISSSNLTRPTFLWYIVARDYHFSQDFQKAREVASRALASPSKISHGIESSKSSAPAEELDQTSIVYDPDAFYRSRLSYFIEAADTVQAALLVNSAQEFWRIGNLFRHHFHDYVSAVYLYNQGIQRFPNSELAANFIFLKVLVYRDWEPKSVRAAVEDLLSTFPNSEFCDDALAELAFVQLTVLWDADSGEQTVLRLLHDYPNGNACDNALNWLAYHYAVSRAPDKARRTYQDILSRYPTTRFARFAREYLAKH